MRVNNVTGQYSLYNNSLQNQKTNAYDINFRGKGNAKPKGDSKLGKFMSKYYAEKMLNTEWVNKLSKRLAGTSKWMTTHMATAGSLLTSSVYMYKTFTNKDLDPEKRRTLVVNQGLGCLAPAVITYTLENKMNSFKKNFEIDYAGRQMRKVALGKMTKSELESFHKNFGNRLKGIPTLLSLTLFTLIYRYFTPVAITPAANYIGEKWNNHNRKEAAKHSAENVNLNPQVEKAEKDKKQAA